MTHVPTLPALRALFAFDPERLRPADRARFVAIGESDRTTLKFVKPLC